MPKVTDGTKVAPHGLFYMESDGGAAPEPPAAPPLAPTTEEHQAGCFALEEERGEGWTGTGAMKPMINEKRPSL